MSTDDPQSLRAVAQAASDRHDGARGRALGRAAEKAKLTLSYTTVDKILDGTYKSRPTRKTLDALAYLSGFSREQVYAAAGEPLPLKPLQDDLPPDADSLTGPQRRVVIDTIRLFAQQNLQAHALEAQLEKVRSGDVAPAAQKTDDSNVRQLPSARPAPQKKAARKEGTRSRGRSARDDGAGEESQERPD